MRLFLCFILLFLPAMSLGKPFSVRVSGVEYNLVTDQAGNPIQIGEGGQAGVYLGRDQDGGEVAIKLHGVRPGYRPRAPVDFDTTELQPTEVGSQDPIRAASEAVRILLQARTDQRRYILPVLAFEIYDKPKLVGAMEVRAIEVMTRGGRSSKDIGYQFRLDQGLSLQDTNGQLIRLCLQVLVALKDMRALGIIHRDIKPGNLVLGPGGHWYLIDWGLALVVPGRAESLGGINPVGSPRYIAPESLVNNEVGHAADLYSLGMTLLSLALGAETMDSILSAHPVEAYANAAIPDRFSSTRQAFLQQLQDTITTVAGDKPSQEALKSSKWLVDAIQAMTSKDPSERQSATADLIRRLEGATGSQMGELASKGVNFVKASELPAYDPSRGRVIRLPVPACQRVRNHPLRKAG